MLTLLFAQVPVDPKTVRTWVEILGEGPIVIILASAAIVFFVMFSWFLWRYGPKLALEHINFITISSKNTEKATEVMAAVVRDISLTTDLARKQQETLERISKSMESSLDPRGDPKFRDHVFSTVRTNQALSHLLDGLLAGAQELYGDKLVMLVKPHADAMREVLNKAKLLGS